MKEETIRKISERIYSLFVVNSSAAGIQQKDGRYITKYIPITPSLIENMILAKGSMGCYQQGYKTGYIKWICLDFDCKDKIDPDVLSLYRETILPVIAYLDEVGIRYLTEFSGRRGIHIWIIFDRIIKKSIGFRILNEIIKKTGIQLNNEKNAWNLDLFPATDSSKNNTVGKQVKFPLSTHKKGGMAFFFVKGFCYRDDLYTDSFFEEQYYILHNYCENRVDEVLNILDISSVYKREYGYKYKKYKILEEIDVTIDDIWTALTGTRVFSELYERMKRGQALPRDWTVLLGTLSPCDKDGTLVRAVFSEFPNYDEEKTTDNLKKYINQYYPATFGYLYHLYGLEMEDGLNPDMTGFTYILKTIGVPEAVVQEYASLNEKKTITSVQDTIQKEKNYLLYNDEAPDIYIWNQLELMKQYDIVKIKEEIDSAINSGIFKGAPERFKKYIRNESDEKSRCLISLSARDRVVTTQLALELCHEYKRKWNSFSYRPSLISQSDIFYAWYRSWGEYIDRIRAFLEVPFFDTYEVMMIDLKGFYDHIDFLTVYETLKCDANSKAARILKYLIGFNDSLMSLINEGERNGVPQGPAYARIIAEIFLDSILTEIEVLYHDDITILRYVDDIVIVCKPMFNSIACFNTIRKKLSEYGLPINTDKSKCFGRIGQLTPEQRALLLHSDNFDYDLRFDRTDGVLLSKERNNNLNKYLQAHEFDLKSIGYVFGSKTLQEAKDLYFKSFRNKIIESTIGRGNNFRRFYQYIFVNESYLNTILDEKLFEEIPFGTVNFSNFINSLYLIVRNKQIDGGCFKRIQQEYLSTIDRTELDEDDLAAVDALLLINLEDLRDEQ